MVKIWIISEALSKSDLCHRGKSKIICARRKVLKRAIVVSFRARSIRSLWHTIKRITRNYLRAYSVATWLEKVIRLPLQKHLFPNSIHQYKLIGKRCHLQLPTHSLHRPLNIKVQPQMHQGLKLEEESGRWAPTPPAKTKSLILNHKPS